MTYRNLHPATLLNGHANEMPQLAEAPCSINGHATINGMTVQVTGRGFTGEEAASNFRHTLAAIQPPVVEAKPEPKSRETQLAELLTCWLSKAVSRGDFGLVERLSKGAALVLADKVQLGNAPGVIAVRSSKEDMTWYDVSFTSGQKSCTCQDYVCHARKGQSEHPCKHVCAAALWQRLG